MNKQSRALVVTGALLLGAALPLTSVGVQTTADTDKMEQMVTMAATTTDHAALAAEYDKEAKAALAQVEHHKAMARAYATLGTGLSKGGTAAFVEHCKRLIAKYEEAAAEYTALAQLHRQFATEMAAS